MEIVFLLVLVAVVVYGWSRRRSAAEPTRGEACPPRDDTARPVATKPPPTSVQQSARTSASTQPRRPSQLSDTLFDHGREGEGVEHDGPYAVIDVETTGLSPRSGDRVIEFAVTRVDARGRVEDEYATLLDPQGRDTGPVFIHRISNEAVLGAPTFADVAGELLSRLEGAVVVAHNADFEERFLQAEFARAGIRVGPLPALCSLRLARRTIPAPNHKLATLCRHHGIPLMDGHAALGDVRAVAQLLPGMLTAHPRLRFSSAPPAVLSHLHPPTGARPRTRAVQLRRGTDGWMSSLLARLPQSATEASDAESEAYLEALGEALDDGRIIGDEAKILAKHAGAAGMGAVQVAALNERFLEGMREAAFADSVLSAAELQELVRAASALGVPDYFDDLTPTHTSPQAQALPGDWSSTASSQRATRAVRRCGHCRRPGHYRPTCPELEP